MPFLPKKILAATDFSAASAPAEDAAIDLAKNFGASLTIVHVIPLPIYPDFSMGIGAGGAGTIDFQAAARAAVKESWREVDARMRGLGITAELVTREGSPALEIAELAKVGHFDLVVLGTHGRTGLKHILLGSVAEGVVRHSPSPVLTIRQG